MKYRNLVLAASIVALSAAAMAQRPLRRADPPNPDAQTRRPRVAAGQMIRRQMEQMRTQHQELMAELEEIRELAKKENADKTVQRTQRLMDRLQARLQERLQGLEERLAQMQQRRIEADDGGKAAPDFTLKAFDGKTISLSELKGRIVVLEWFNFECPFSKYHYATKPTMVELAKKYADQGVVWLAVNSTNHTRPDQNIAFVEQYKLPYPILDDRDGKVGRAYDAKTTPQMIVINKRGNIVYDGAIDNAPMGRVAGGAEAANYVDQVLTALTAGRTVKLETTKPYGCSVKYAQ